MVPSGNAAGVSPAATSSAAHRPIAMLRAKLMQKSEPPPQRDRSHSTESCTTSSDPSPSLTTRSSLSGPLVPVSPEVQSHLVLRLEDCLGRPGRPPERLESKGKREDFISECASALVCVELAEEDERGLAEVLADAGLWSTGSSRHVSGTCRPCHYVRSSAGCENGQSCEFCHFPHTGKSRKQLGMCSRLYCKSFGETLVQAYRGRPEQLQRAAAAASTGSDYLASIVKDRAKQLPEWSGDAPRVDDAPAEAPDRRKIIVSL